MVNFERENTVTAITRDIQVCIKMCFGFVVTVCIKLTSLQWHNFHNLQHSFSQLGVELITTSIRVYHNHSSSLSQPLFSLY